MKSILFSILLLCSVLTYGQYDYSERCIKAHQLITKLQIDSARLIIQEEKINNPENLIPVLLENYIDFLTIIVGEDKEEFKNIEYRKSERLKFLEKGDKSSPFYKSSLAHIYLEWAFARVKFEEYITAAREVRKAFILLNENQEEYPGFLPDKVGLGILHALVGTIPDNYRWVANLFAMDGSVQLGREELLEVLETADERGYPYLRDEALFFITFIDLNLQANAKRSIELLPYYDDVSDDNLMMVYAKSRILLQSGYNDQAIELLIHRPKSKSYFPFYYLEYLTGLAKLNRLDENAAMYFLRFTANFKGTSFVKSAYQRVAWSWLLRADTGMYNSYMNKVAKSGDDFIDGDKIAMAAANDGGIPNVCLLKARLLYDGGYYNRADSVLNDASCSLSSDRDKTEFPYRKGRISQSMGNTEEAIEWYNQTMQIGSSQKFYFAANAALQVGNIYESAGNLNLAEEYYKKCLKMKNQEYKTSISQKAKAGLNRLDDKREE